MTDSNKAPSSVQSAAEDIDRLPPRSRREVIFDACDNLLSEREQVTEAKILNIVGGSSNTVHRYVSEWKKTYGIKRQAQNVPSTVLSELDKIFVGMREEIKSEFDERLKSIEEEASTNDEELAAVEDALADAQKKLDERTQQVDHLQVTLTQREESLEAVLGRVDELKGELKQCRGKLEAKEQENRDLTAQHEKAIEQEKARIDKEVDRLDRIYQVSEERLMQQMDSLRTGHADELSRLNTEINRLTHRIDTQREEYEGRLASVNEARQEKEVENAGLEAKVSALEDTVSSLKEQLASANEKAEARRPRAKRAQ